MQDGIRKVSWAHGHPAGPEVCISERHILLVTCTSQSRREKTPGNSAIVPVIGLAAEDVDVSRVGQVGKVA